MSKRVFEIDFQEKVELPVPSFPPFKLRSSMVDKDPVIWAHLIEVYIQYIQTILQLKNSTTERSEEQLCAFLKSYLREIADEQDQILSLGLINVQITENLNILKSWVLELIKQFGALQLKLNGSALWDFAKVYGVKNAKDVRGIIDGEYKPKSMSTINSILLVQKHIEYLITNAKMEKIDVKVLFILLNENSISSSSSGKGSSKGGKKSLNGDSQKANRKQTSSFSEKFVTTEWFEILDRLYSAGSGHFASIVRDLGVISILSLSTVKIASLATELGIVSYKTLSLNPLFAAIITSEPFKKSRPELSSKLPFLNITGIKRVQVHQDDVNTLIELFPNLTISQSEKLLKRNDLSVERVTNLLLENPDLAISRESSRHVYEDREGVFNDGDFISNKRVTRKATAHVPDEHKNKTLTAALRLMYEADDDEKDDTYEEAEASAGGSTAPVDTKLDKIEGYLWDLFKKDQIAFDKSSRKTRQRKEMKNETGWSDEQIEGWAKMIQRSPKRAKLLEEKFMFKGNKPWKSSFDRGKPNDNIEASGEKETNGTPKQQQQQQDQGHTSNPNKSGTDSKRTNAKNEKNKASRANHNRKAGHDKKLAKGY